MHVRTEVAASMHRDSGLLLTTHDTENPTDTHTSDHLNTASHIFFLKKILLPVFFAVFSLQGPNAQKGTFCQAELISSLGASPGPSAPKVGPL